MAADETELTFEQPRSMFGTWLGVVLLFAVFGLFVWVVVGAMPRGDDYEKKRATARMEKLKTTREEADIALHKYAWVDKEKGVARVPIQRAMELSVAELAQKKPAQANPIATAPPGGAQTTAPVAPAASTVAPSAATAASATSTPTITSVHGKDSEIRGQPAAAANPQNAAPGTQPGPDSTPAASPASGASRPQPGESQPSATPVQSPPGTPLPVPGKTP